MNILDIIERLNKLEEENRALKSILEENKTMRYYSNDNILITDYSIHFNPCDSCLNSPRNGGSGMCCCSLPQPFTSIT